jgi:hypothetical protein
LPISNFSGIGSRIDQYNNGTAKSAEKRQQLKNTVPTDTFMAYTQQLGSQPATMEGYQKYLSQSATGFKGVSEAINNFNEMQDKGIKQQQDYATAIGTTNTKLGNYLTNLNGAKASMSGYAASLVGATLKTIGLQIASTALNVALSMGVSLAIQGLISGISYLIHRNENLIESAKELTSTYNEQAKTLSDNVKSLKSQRAEFERLSEGVDEYGNNISLSSDEYEKYKSIVSEILGYSPELIAGYDEEGNAIAKKNGLIEQSIALLKEEQRQKLEEATSKDSFETLYKGARNERKNKKNDYHNNVIGDTYGLTNTIYAEPKAIIEKITGEELYDAGSYNNNNNNKEELFNYFIKYKDVLSQNLDDLYSALKEQGWDDSQIQQYIKWIQKVEKSIDELDSSMYKYE